MSSQPQQFLDHDTPTTVAPLNTTATSGVCGRARARGRWPSPGVCLLDADPDLGSELSDEERAVVQRHVVLPTIALAGEPWEWAWLSGASGVSGEVRGCLILSGAITSEIMLGERACTRLLGPGELVLLDRADVDSVATNDSIPMDWSWSVLMPARLAIFDDRLLAIGRYWPGLLSAILRRATQTTRNGFLQQAVSQLPRVEARLLALLWILADRHGVVRGDGVWLKLPATHETLARMVGAQRPTVSLALRALTEQGCLRTEPGGWLIDRSSLQQLTPSTGPDQQVSPTRHTVRSAAEPEADRAPTTIIQGCVAAPIRQAMKAKHRSGFPIHDEQAELSASRQPGKQTPRLD